jgi:ADP-ribose pyrophosphatase
MLFLDVDMDDPRNQHPVPQLEENEYIECFTLPLAGLWGELARLEGEGFAIDARVATVAQGMELARRYRDVVLG